MAKMANPKVDTLAILKGMGDGPPPDSPHVRFAVSAPLASMYPALIGARCAPGHHGYQRACDLISGQTSTGPSGSPVFACAGKTEPPSRFILSQTSAESYRAMSRRLPYRALDDQTVWAVTRRIVLVSKLRPCARTLQAMRASLLASAIASTL